MEFLHYPLTSKKQINKVIRYTEDKVVAIRFGRASDPVCMQQDYILSKASPYLSKIADIYIVEVDDVPEYVQYFDITLIPATIFFFNTKHIKINAGTQDNTKWIGAFQTKQDCIDMIEVICRGAMRGKYIVDCPIDKARIPQYSLYYKNI
ncbi:thioredoxin-like protein [Piromyces finnis]|uniref:Spliceosomal protein DIB1 n=1 Tax=Piromyces finnis TaxID=1754191 RepID=A0A1Y1VE26_9FUNG|nr:thioredoxin-like protein [Piromyces finnis]|eukprot:ORX52993.1 thioredoxin-like protein [Piromyces finnis]